MMKPIYLMLALPVMLMGCGNGYDLTDAGSEGEHQSRLGNETRSSNIRTYFQELRDNPAGKVIFFKNCTINYTKGTANGLRASFFGRVLIRLHNNQRTGEKYFKHFNEGWFSCDSVEVLLRDEGKFVHRLNLKGNVLLLLDSPAWCPIRARGIYYVDDDRYESVNHEPINRFSLAVEYEDKITGGGNGGG